MAGLNNMVILAFSLNSELVRHCMVINTMSTDKSRGPEICVF
jgi:hypothetical protein